MQVVLNGIRKLIQLKKYYSIFSYISVLKFLTLRKKQFEDFLGLFKALFFTVLKIHRKFCKQMQEGTDHIKQYAYCMFVLS